MIINDFIVIDDHFHEHVSLQSYDSSMFGGATHINSKTNNALPEVSVLLALHCAKRKERPMNPWTRKRLVMRLSRGSGR